MAILKERIEELKSNYTFEEISFVYHEVKHNISLGRGIKGQIEAEDNAYLIEYISKKLAEKYTGDEINYARFKESSRMLYELFQGMPNSISLNDILNNMPEMIEKKCMEMVETI